MEKSPRLEAILSMAEAEAIRLGHKNVATFHILLAMCKENESIALIILDRFIGRRLTYEEIDTEIRNIVK